jgi:hypothetical protein
MKQYPITFVNLCVDIDRGKIDLSNTIHRDFELYKQGFYENINSSLPIVSYTSIKDVNIPPHRNDSNLRINYFDKISIENEFPNFELYKHYYNISHKDEIASLLFYYTPLVVLKLKKMIDVINENPFNTDYFVWMDCYFERGLDPNIFKDDILSRDFCDKTINKLQDKFLLLAGAGTMLNSINFNGGPEGVFRPFGFFWGAHKDVLLKIYEKYFEVFFEFLPKGILTEELIFFILCRRYPELFNIVDLAPYGGLYKQGLLNYLNDSI